MLEFDSLKEVVAEFYGWLTAHVFTFAALQQFLIITCLFLASLVITRRLSARLEPAFQIWRERNLSFLASRIHISMRELMSLVLFTILLWVALLISAAAKWPVVIINGAASLVTAWALIRITSSLINSNFWSKTLAFTLWTVAALNILGWLEPSMIILDTAAITFGTRKISLLLVIKGAIIFSLLFWLAGLASEGLERAMGRSRALNPSQIVLFNKLARICFLGLAIVLGLNAVGIDLTALAVFSGALGIGVGFGLQKVFANLVSGFILLIDKSIKPGDVIAIGDTYGWVNRLGARYVSILTRDGKEHLIPNEQLITLPVENWSYSDDKVRIHIPVGVSFNTDIHLAKKIQLEVAQSQPRILKIPMPTCLISGFGDNSINFEIRAWIQDPVNGVGNVRSSVYEAVWDAFKKNNIEIPYPQRDIHFKSDGVAQALMQLAEKLKTEPSV